MITVGVEEEYVLLDPATFLPTPQAEEVRAAAGLESWVSEGEVQNELLQAQVEVATPVCTDLSEVGGHLLRLRHAVGSAAEENGCRIAMSATAPLRDVVPVPVTQQPRYLKMREEARRLVDEQLINGMHVHVGVPDREMGVAVLNRLRVWLPTLLAMSANSPLWDGRDTGFASWRTIVFGRWPVSGPPPHFRALADYEERVEALLAAGMIADRGQLYWQARLSERYPTVEVRCLDVQLEADAAVLFAGIVRALVATAIAEEEAGSAPVLCPPELLQAANWHAARHGLNSALVDPQGCRRSAGDVLCMLIRRITPALEESGDLREVSALVHRLLQEGTPADRQRRALADGGMPALVDLITAAAVPR
ncbi:MULTISPECIES: glutamate--cysteine ligase [unclassified Streptomyces]|uniref:carboxylate-amine ligase n=1 Tax=unclassified Streptomyces TaxID=2593676 RepID=UPI001BEA9CCE|nr:MULTISPECIES: glutamate--cysteine ligase [unclassified Streptomyces]MBT2408073.1 glutamate--cysteine ligase [Streptomyces sp. ISL-21]MBT2455774.1 glutamate--cysteine ligase [Streptomyces sp. ISL-86]MBT2609523.1 glutamate--cysteine ligase [Streptomyces sp. ISL-87]